MSDDDWENQLDSDAEEEEKKKEEAKKEEEKKKWAEDTVDQEKLKKEKEQAKKEEEQKRQAQARKKNVDAKFDPDAAFKKRQQQYGGATVTTKAEDLKGMSAQAKGQILEQQAEVGLVDQLFLGDGEDSVATPTVVKLNDQKDYIKFGEQTAKVLYAGAAPYRIENFMKELCKDLKNHCDAQQIKKIIDNLTVMHKEKEKAEKAARGTGGKKGNAGGAKATLKGGGGKGYARNNNEAMIQDQMGGDDYGDYGDEDDSGFRREGERDTDFM